MTKKEQTALMLAAINRIHYHKTLTQNDVALNFVLERMMIFAQLLAQSENIKDTKEQDKAVIAAYKNLENLP